MARRLRSGAKLLGKGSAPGALYDLGYYPGATFAPETKTRVTGEVFVVHPASPLKTALDIYEGAETDAAGSMYGPVEVEVELDRGGREARDRLCAEAHPALRQAGRKRRLDRPPQDARGAALPPLG